MFPETLEEKFIVHVAVGKKKIFSPFLQLMKVNVVTNSAQTTPTHRACLIYLTLLTTRLQCRYLMTYIILSFISSRLSTTKYRGCSPVSGYLVIRAELMSNSLCSGSLVTQYCSSWQPERRPAPYAFKFPSASLHTPNSTVYQ